MPLEIQMPIEAYVVYINPEFTLMSAQENADYLLPSQIPQYFQTLQVSGNVSPEQQRLADTLIRMHNPRYFAEELPTIDYGKLQKDLFCLACGSAVRLDGIKSVYCPVCRKRERTTKMIAHNIEEFRLLFPDEEGDDPADGRVVRAWKIKIAYIVCFATVTGLSEKVKGAITYEQLKIGQHLNS